MRLTIFETCSSSIHKVHRFFPGGCRNVSAAPPKFQKPKKYIFFKSIELNSFDCVWHLSVTPSRGTSIFPRGLLRSRSSDTRSLENRRRTPPLPSNKRKIMRCCSDPCKPFGKIKVITRVSSWFLI